MLLWYFSHFYFFSSTLNTKYLYFHISNFAENLMESSESSMRTTLGQHGGKGASLNLPTCALVCLSVPTCGERFEITSDELACRVWFVSRAVPVTGPWPGPHKCTEMSWKEDWSDIERIGDRLARFVWEPDSHQTPSLCGNWFSFKGRTTKDVWFWTETNGKLPVVLQLIVVAAFSSFCSRLLHPDSADVPPCSDSP